MKNKKTITMLVLAIAILSGIASFLGIFSRQGTGPYEHISVRGQEITIHGYGVYRHMSADLAIQGSAQDLITFFLAIPLLLISLMLSRKGGIRSRILLGGTLFYFLVSYLFYLSMGAYNELFLIYVVLLGLSFFAFSLVAIESKPETIKAYLYKNAPVKFPGIFLMANSLIIGSLWLSIVVPPLLDGSIIPIEVRHYTTLIVQGIDLGLLLPLSFVSGWLLLRRNPWGYLMAPVYLVFLSFLMTALVAKITAMQLNGVPAGPSLVIIPLFTLISIACAFILLRKPSP
jgi:hypothetical protein